MFKCGHCGQVCRPGVRPVMVVTKIRKGVKGFDIVEEQMWWPVHAKRFAPVQPTVVNLVEGGETHGGSPRIRSSV